MLNLTLYHTKGRENMNSKIFYALSEPTEKNTDHKYPAILLMHGMGSNENDLLSIVESLKNDFYIISLRGPIAQPPGYAFFTIERIGYPQPESFIHILNEIQKFIEEAVNEYPIDEDKIYLAGFSQGAILSQSLAALMGNKLAGIVALSGYLPNLIGEMEKAPMNRVKVLLTHGEQDQVIPFSWSKESKEFFEANGAKVQYYTYAGGHFVTPELVQKIEEYFHHALI